MSFVKSQKSKVNGSTEGFTLIEVLVSIAILGIITAIGVSSFINFNKREALEVESGKLIALISQARTETLSAKDGSAYGVHFETGKVVLFKGTVYSAGAATNRVQTLNDEVKISAITLTSGAVDVLFKKLSGATLQTGTVTLASIRDTSDTRVITITGTGVAYSN